MITDSRSTHSLPNGHTNSVPAFLTAPPPTQANTLSRLHRIHCRLRCIAPGSVSATAIHSAYLVYSRNPFLTSARTLPPTRSRLTPFHCLTPCVNAFEPNSRVVYVALPKLGVYFKRGNFGTNFLPLQSTWRSHSEVLCKLLDASLEDL